MKNYYHDCPALGKKTKIIEATLLDSDNQYVLGWHNKCPFCSKTAGKFRLAPGVIKHPDGRYIIEIDKAISTEGAEIVS